MFKCIKRRRIDEEEDSENESKLSEPSTNKVEKEMTNKEIRLYNDSYLAMGFTWTGDENCPHPLCIVWPGGGGAIKWGCGPGTVKSTLTTKHSHISKN
jgi:hypothetical protein